MRKNCKLNTAPPGTRRGKSILLPHSARQATHCAIAVLAFLFLFFLFLSRVDKISLNYAGWVQFFYLLYHCVERPTSNYFIDDEERINSHSYRDNKLSKQSFADHREFVLFEARATSAFAINVTVCRVCIDLFYFPHTILCVRQINNITFNHYVLCRVWIEGRAFRDQPVK